MVESRHERITPTGNTGLAKVAVQCSADTFVVNQSLVLRINICGENRHLRQARKRYAQCRGTDLVALEPLAFCLTSTFPRDTKASKRAN